MVVRTVAVVVKVILVRVMIQKECEGGGLI